MARRKALERLLLFLSLAAGVQLILALAGAITGFLTGAPVPPSSFVYPVWLDLAIVAPYAFAGASLIFGGGRDERARVLGVAFLLGAAQYSPRLVLMLTAGVPPEIRGFLSLASRFPIPFFLPAVLWLFARDFPAAPDSERMRQGISVGIALTVTWGSVASSGRLWIQVAELLPPLRSGNGLAGVLSGDRPERAWVVLLVLFAASALAAIGLRAHRAPVEERRRTSLFFAALAGGFSPLLLMSLLEALFPGSSLTLRSPASRAIVGVFVFVPILLVPFATAYAVAVHHVLDVRLIVRKALQHLMARLTLATTVTLPIALLVRYVYIHREARVSELFTGTEPLALGVLAVTGLVALSFRSTALDALDRRFFREQYDTRLLLTQLAERSRGAGSASELAALVTSEIDRALHLDALSLLVASRETGKLVAPDGSARSLDVSSPLASLVASCAEPLETDLEKGPSAITALPDEDRSWIADGGFGLLVPMLASDGSLLALLALGNKKSELPFDTDDRRLLDAIAASGALALENRLLRSSSRGGSSGPSGAALEPAPSSDLARECPSCLAVFPSLTERCPACEMPLSAAILPYVLGGKFRLESRIGAGGMGVVYKGIDLTLGRHVAIKALPRVSPELAMRLRREARAAAAFSHPNLAFIYGSESWRGVPILVFEYLEGGTLGDRIALGPLPPKDVVRIGIVLAGVLERMHAAGVLHRDIKPRNIGLTAEGVPKLLDFGLARMLSDVRADRASGSRTPEGRTVTDPHGLTGTDCVVGTPGYLSPEAVTGEPPAPSFDLWGLSVVLYEATTGANPLADGRLAEILQKTLDAAIPDAARLVPGTPPELAAFLTSALSRSLRERPRSAAELRERLLLVESRLSTRPS